MERGRLSIMVKISTERFMTNIEKLQFYKAELNIQSSGFKNNSRIYLAEIDQIIAGIESGFSFLIDLGKTPNKELLDTIEGFYDLRKKYEHITN